MRERTTTTTFSCEICSQKSAAALTSGLNLSPGDCLHTRQTYYEQQSVRHPFRKAVKGSFKDMKLTVHPKLLSNSVSSTANVIAFLFSERRRLLERQRNRRAESKAAMTSPCLSWTKTKVGKSFMNSVSEISLNHHRNEKCPPAEGAKKKKNFFQT